MATAPERQPVPMMLIHGAWLAANSWDTFAGYFEGRISTRRTCSTSVPLPGTRSCRLDHGDGPGDVAMIPLSAATWPAKRSRPRGVSRARTRRRRSLTGRWIAR
jgi:hypothetical protein